MKNYIVVGYFTKDTIYQGKAQVLLESLARFNVPNDIIGVKNLGDWWKNTCYKPTFLKEMLCKHFPTPIVYVDVDAEFMKYPILFETFDGDVGVYVFDRSEYRKSIQGFEVLSGTIFLKNNDKVFDMIERWELECQMNPKVWDQKSLEKTLNGEYTLLPGEYCKIFDRMKFVADPVIVHYQASREVRRTGIKITCIGESR